MAGKRDGKVVHPSRKTQHKYCAENVRATLNREKGGELNRVAINALAPLSSSAYHLLLLPFFMTFSFSLTTVASFPFFFYIFKLWWCREKKKWKIIQHDERLGSSSHLKKKKVGSKDCVCKLESTKKPPKQDHRPSGNQFNHHYRGNQKI